MILVIDNHDSFAWNIVHRIAEVDPSLEIGRSLVVVRNDAITIDEVRLLDENRGPSHIVLSPGPCTPSEAGISCDVIRAFAGTVPILGVCLGHQCIGEVFGMRIEQYEPPIHGMTSEVAHTRAGVFAGIDSPMIVARYHSLTIARDSIPGYDEHDEHGMWRVDACVGQPDECRVDHRNDDCKDERVVMAIQRVWTDTTKAPLIGVQFHPESFMTPAGHAILANFLRMGDRPRDAKLPTCCTAQTQC